MAFFFGFFFVCFCARQLLAAKVDLQAKNVQAAVVWGWYH